MNGIQYPVVFSPGEQQNAARTLTFLLLHSSKNVTISGQDDLLLTLVPCKKKKHRPTVEIC